MTSKAHERRLGERGIAFTERASGDAPRRLVVQRYGRQHALVLPGSSGAVGHVVSRGPVFAECHQKGGRQQAERCQFSVNYLGDCDRGRMRWQLYQPYARGMSLRWQGSSAQSQRYATARLTAVGGRTPLHVVTDWPGYFPNGPAIVHCSSKPERSRTPATPGDRGDAAALGGEQRRCRRRLEALIEAGADIEAPDGSIGTPLDNAIGYGCWHVARCSWAPAPGRQALARRRARPARRLETLAGQDPPVEERSKAFWHACAGGNAVRPEHLLAQGADLDWVPTTR